MCFSFNFLSIFIKDFNCRLKPFTMKIIIRKFIVWRKSLLFKPFILKSIFSQWLYGMSKIKTWNKIFLLIFNGCINTKNFLIHWINSYLYKFFNRWLSCAESMQINNTINYLKSNKMKLSINQTLLNILHWSCIYALLSFKAK